MHMESTTGVLHTVVQTLCQLYSCHLREAERKLTLVLVKCDVLFEVWAPVGSPSNNLTFNCWT
jgi:hypothetical protein